MVLAKIVAIVGLISMAVALIYGFSAGTFSTDGAALIKMPWGVVSLVDVYVGFLLFSIWVFYRERKLWIALIWVVMIMVLGNFIASLYVLLALILCGGDWKKFWLGSRT